MNNRIYVYGKAGLVGITNDTKANRAYYEERGFEVFQLPQAARSIERKYTDKGGKK